MSQKRKTPEDDIDRLAERIWQRGRGKIHNKADFLAVYSSYLKDNQARDNIELSEGAFKSIQRSHKNVSSSVKTKRERMEVFVRAGEKPSPKEFSVVGKSKGRTVFARRTKYLSKGKEITIFRDKKGRFVRVSDTLSRADKPLHRGYAYGN